MRSDPGRGRTIHRGHRGELAPPGQNVAEVKQLSAGVLRIVQEDGEPTACARSNDLLSYWAIEAEEAAVVTRRQQADICRPFHSLLVWAAADSEIRGDCDGHRSQVDSAVRTSQIETAKRKTRSQ